MIAPDRFSPVPSSGPTTGGSAASAPSAQPVPTVEECKAIATRAARFTCLRGAVTQAERRVELAVVGVREQLMLREDVNASRRTFWIAALDASHQGWSAVRDLECSRLSASEPALGRDPYEARLLCLVRENDARRQSLEGRFPLRSD